MKSTEEGQQNLLQETDNHKSVVEVSDTNKEVGGSGFVSTLVSASISNKKRKQNPSVSIDEPDKGDKAPKSQYWAHFDKIAVIGSMKCKYCSTLIRSTPQNGTSSLKNHLERCRRYPSNLDRKQKLIAFESKTIISEDGNAQVVNIPKLWKFDQENARRELARMVIIDELPFTIVEREGFRRYSKALNPEFLTPSRQTITRDCYGLFIEERRKLACSLHKLSSRVCHTTDSWTSRQNLCYMALTTHFIDDDWKLHKRIINFCPIAGHSGELIGRAVEKCFNEWGLKKVLTITLDNASPNDLAIQYLKKIINHWDGGVLEGKYLQVRCAAHILNLVVKDGLKDLNASIVRIRVDVRYVRSSPARLQRFKACVEEEEIEYKGLLCLDVDTRWNSTFLMIESALKFRKAFDNLKLKDAQFVKEFTKLDGPPCNSDWEKVKCFVPILKIFCDATLKLSGSRYVTGNYYIRQIFGVGFLISKKCTSNDSSMRLMSTQMKATFDKYWGNVDKLNILLYVALVLDPRQKWNYTKWVVNNSYDSEKAEMLSSRIKLTLRSLFDAYESSMPQPKIVQASAINTSAASLDSYGEDEEIMDVQQLLKMEYMMKMGTMETTEKKNELDKYLADECEQDDVDFDVLQWWKYQKNRYPILSMIARDMLAIPVTSVASESAFSTGGRVLDSFRTSLTPRMVEALVCTQDWIRTSRESITVEESLPDLEKLLEEGMKELVLEQPIIHIDESNALDEE